MKLSVYFLLTCFAFLSACSDDKVSTVLYPQETWYYKLSDSKEWVKGKSYIGCGYDTIIKEKHDTLYIKIPINALKTEPGNNYFMELKFQANYTIFLDNHPIEYLQIFPNQFEDNPELLVDKSWKYRNIFNKRIDIGNSKQLSNAKNILLEIITPNTLVENKSGLCKITTGNSSPFAKKFKKRSSTNIPVITINTEADTIPDEPKVSATLNITGRETSNNNIPIGIETRGNTTQSLKKKSYSIKVLNKDDILFQEGENNNRSWVLHSSGFDKSFLRNTLAFSIWESIGYNSPDFRYVHLIINNDYRGLYILVEKLKHKTVNSNYLIAVDRYDLKDNVFRGITPPESSIIKKYIIQYPKREKLDSIDHTVIKNKIIEFENLALDLDNNKGLTKIAEHIDLVSFADFIIVQELLKNIDAYYLSTFFHFTKNSKITMGPLWDFDLSLGLPTYKQGFDFEGWKMNGYEHIPFWMKNIANHKSFYPILLDRWKYFKMTLEIEKLDSLVDSLAAITTDEIAYDQERWNTIGRETWPNFFTSGSFEDEIGYLKFWIHKRYDWMNQQFIETGEPFKFF
jgi:hypothetical protein